MCGFETYRQSRDYQSSEETRNRQRKQESADACPKKSQWDDVSPSVPISPSSNDSAEEKAWEPIPSKYDPDSQVLEMIAACDQQTQPSEDSSVKDAVTEDERHRPT